jgi:Rps23 Pro-64 3,4-dihydroxylase Tpa1-like proline 4-hydroxylase
MFKYTTIESFLSKNECQEILSFSLNNLNLKEATIGNPKKPINTDVRKSQVAFENYRIHFPKIIKNLENKFNKVVNIKGHELDFSETHYQFTEYKTGDYYNWHTDSNENNDNKFRYCSIVIQLSEDYTGGILELVDEGEVIKFNSGIGNVFIFLSNKLHRVTQVESGVRYSLVGWFALKTIKNYEKTLL